MSVSLPQYPSLTCVGCAGTFAPELYVIVDARERPDLVAAIKADIVHCVMCPHCQGVIAVGLPLMVYRPQERVRIIYSPWPDATPDQQHEHLGALFEHLRQRLGRRWDDGLTRGFVRAERDDLPLLVDADLDLLPGGRDPTLREAVLEFLGCRTWEEARAVVRAHPVLLGPEAVVFFRVRIRGADEEGDRRTAAVLGEHLAALEECARDGADAAFASRLDGSGRTRMPGVLW
jgi:hypothetical protein